MYYISEKKPHSFLWSVAAVIIAVTVSVGYFELRLTGEQQPPEDIAVNAQNDSFKAAPKVDFADINRYKNAVVGVSNGKLTNSGFFVNNNGYVLSSGFNKDETVSVWGKDTVEGKVTWVSKELGICVIKTDKTNNEYVSLEEYANVGLARSVAVSSMIDEIGYYVNVVNISSDRIQAENALGEGINVLLYAFDGAVSRSGQGALVSDADSNPVGIVVSQSNQKTVKVLPFRIAGAAAKKVIQKNELKLPDLGVMFEESVFGTEIKITDKEKKGYTSGLRDGDLIRFINRSEIKNINDAYSELILYTDYPEIVFSVERNGESDEIRIII